MSTVEIVLADLAAGHFRMPIHALERSDSRSISREDIQAVGQDPIDVQKSDDGRFTVFGLDVYGDDLTVICAYHHGTLIVTVY